MAFQVLQLMRWNSWIDGKTKYNVFLVNIECAPLIHLTWAKSDTFTHAKSKSASCMVKQSPRWFWPKIVQTDFPCLFGTVMMYCMMHFRHALPLFTSMLNIVCSYDPVGYGVPYNHLMFNDCREPLVEIALQVLCVTMENESSGHNVSIDGTTNGTAMDQHSDVSA